MSSSSESNNYYPAYTGVWTNWSRGRVLGATLTLSRHDADLLIAFTAFFVAWVSTRVWRIMCFIAHRLLSTAMAQNSTYHQQQGILRNASNAEEGIQLLWQLFWANRRRRSGRRFQPLLMVILAGFCIAIFTVAGGYSSQISTALGDEVLIKSANCRNVASTFTKGRTLSDTALSMSTWSSESIDSAANYAQQCYASNSTGLVDCRRFTTKRLPNQIDRNAACPFSSEICRNSAGNIRIDSGYQDSHNQFGLNSPPDQRIIWRNVLHCAPLNTDNFTSQVDISTEPLTLYHYGTVDLGNGTQRDYVATARSLESQYSSHYSVEEIVSYANFDMQVLSSYVMKGKPIVQTDMFTPIDAMARTDAELKIVLLSGNGVVFVEPGSDEWYRVSDTGTNILQDSEVESSRRVYYPLDPASPLGCTDQYQFCNPGYRGGRACGPLTSFYDALVGAVPYFNTTEKGVAKSDMLDRFKYFYETFAFVTISNIINHLGPASLLSQVHLQNTAQNHLEPNQWQLDVAHWWDILMANKQALYLDAAYSSPEPAILANYVNYTAPAQIELCQNQKMRSTAYASFSLFGLIFTFVVGFLIVLFSYIQEPLSTWIFKKRGRKPYQHLEWTTNATLQLYRLAQEEMGWGTWSDCTELVPTTKDDDMLGCVDITDPKHPGIAASPQRHCGQCGGNGSVKVETDAAQDTTQIGITSDSTSTLDDNQESNVTTSNVSGSTAQTDQEDETLTDEEETVSTAEGTVYTAIVINTCNNTTAPGSSAASHTRAD
ncbi:hypothetical protein GGS20DRAFT_570297 [Poronia punctata]|nr:hypothetical protein GGS20DRAFT_570297 [Poronia punctata]